MQSLGADAVIDYRKSEDDQLQDLKAITGGNFYGIFDSVAKSIGWSIKALKELSTTDKKHFTTTDDWYAFQLSYINQPPPPGFEGNYPLTQRENQSQEPRNQRGQHIRLPNRPRTNRKIRRRPRSRSDHKRRSRLLHPRHP